MSKYTQDDEPLAIETPLGKDALLLESFKGQEILSGLFHFELTCLSVEDQIDDTKIVGKKVSFRVDNGSGNPRCECTVCADHWKERRACDYQYIDFASALTCKWL